MTSSANRRPTTAIDEVLLNSMDDMFADLVRRLDGLPQAEYLWEPVESPWPVWSVRETPEGAIVDTDPDRAIDPAPVTTIAWRLWHITSDCFTEYSARFQGESLDQVDRSWTMDHDEAIVRLRASWAEFRSVLHAFDDWFEELGAGFGPWHRHCVADFAMHASNELVHHGAEIALLRDLYLAQRQS